MLNYSINKQIIDNLPEYWKKIFYCSKKEVVLNYDKEMEKSVFLYSQYIIKDTISSYTFKELLKLSDFTIICFYVLLYSNYGYVMRRPKGILENQVDESWIFERDFCFFNIRAVGNVVEEPGNIIDAIKLLPTLRVNAIHLAPFFECSFGIIYCQKSFEHINHEIVNIRYLDEKITDEEQLKFFIDCCHLLNIAVGFDVVPHMSKDSVLRLNRPDLFRWVKVIKDRNMPEDIQSIDKQYTEEMQIKIQNEIKNLVIAECEKNNTVDLIDIYDFKIIDKINRKLESLGYYTVPPHTWNGISIPRFKKYSNNMKCPIWEYKDKYGREQDQHAIWLHSGFYIHKDLRPNYIPMFTSKNIKCRRNNSFFEFFINYLKKIIIKYKFDFLRVDYVDHIFDNIVMGEKGEEFLLCEVIMPSEFKEIVEILKEYWKGLAVLADHIGKDIDLYSKAGFNLIMSPYALRKNNKNNLDELFGELKEKKNCIKKCNMVWTIDTHDMGHPLFYGRDLPLREGKLGVAVRFFISRFANIGKNRLPKYEVIGNQDLSLGIYRANNRPESIFWGNDKEMFRLYHNIEDLYIILKDELRQSEIIKYTIGNTMVTFLIKLYNKKKYWIGVFPICDVSWSFKCDDKVIFPVEFSNDVTINTRMSVSISQDENFNYVDIDKLCSIEVNILSSKIELILKQRGIAMLEIS